MLNVKKNILCIKILTHRYYPVRVVQKIGMGAVSYKLHMHCIITGFLRNSDLELPMFKKNHISITPVLHVSPFRVQNRAGYIAAGVYISDKKYNMIYRFVNRFFVNKLKNS